MFGLQMFGLQMHDFSEVVSGFGLCMFSTNVRLLRSRERVRTLILFYKCSTSSEVVALLNDLLIRPVSKGMIFGNERRRSILYPEFRVYLMWVAPFY